jgi:formylglycine-generating enzyme required for sulfatase activity
MVRLPPGRYDLDGWTRGGGSRRRAHLASFLLDATEVTVAAYGACVAKGPCTEPRAGGACNGTRPDRADHPVNCVTWSQAAAYCAWAGKRLPYEAEWEWAARGGDLGYAYPWGGLPPSDQLCWNGEGNDLGKGRRRGTCRVGSYPEGDTALGLKDMAGNVWEWMADLDDDGRPAGLHRGGGWDTGGGWRFSVADDAPRQLSPSSRGATADPALARDWLGFRCASSP